MKLSLEVILDLKIEDVSVARPFCSSESDILIFLLVNKSVAQLGFKISQVRNPEP